MIDVSYTENELQIGDETITLEYDVKDVLVVDETVLVLQQVPSGVREDQNVVAFDLEGNHRWDIAPPTEGMKGQPYSFIRNEDGRVEANNWNAYKFEVDIDTGNVMLIRRFRK